MSAPWWHPEANPLRDIQEVARELERQYASGFSAPQPMGLPEPVVVVAPRFKEALTWACRERLARRRWHWARLPEELYGLLGGTVVLVNSSRLAGDPGEWFSVMQVLGRTGTVIRQEVT